MDESGDKLKFQYLAGGSLIKFAPLFSPDDKIIFVITGKNVQVYSSSTGQVIRVLQGAKDPLISLEYNLNNNNILVACTETGELISWKWHTGVIQRRLQLKISGSFKYHTCNFLNLNIKKAPYAVVTGVKRGMPVQCFIVNCFDGKVLNVLDVKFNRKKAIVAVNTNNFQFFVIAQGTYLFFINYLTWEWRKLKNGQQPITFVKVHPEEEMVATGDGQGQIILWRNFYKIGDEVRMTFYNWHSTQVTCINFSTSGSSMYSSGLETVLVKWNITRPDVKNFLPRMSAVILHIALNSDSSCLAVSTADNGIHILDTDFKTKCTVQNFTYSCDDKTEQDKFPVGLKVNPRQSTLVLNGRVGHLQFFSVYTKSLLYNVDIVGQNLISYESEKILYNTRVTQVAHNIDWMATAEVFNDQQHLPEVRLKFWIYNKIAQDYNLVTCIELAHEGGIKAIEFSNPYYVANLLCATVGYDNIIKIWSLVDSNNIYKAEKVWYCIGQTDYKNMPIESIAFSEDGSLLAAGFGNNLCVYKAENLSLLTSLVAGGSFDGCLHKAQIIVPKVNKNGSKTDLNTNRKKIVQLFSSLLQAKDETLLKYIKDSVKTRTINEIQTIDNAQKQILYKKIRSMSQLNLFQKLSLYRKLGISFQLSEEWHLKMVEYIRDNTPSTARCNILTDKIPCLNVRSRFKAKYMMDKYVKRKLCYDQNVANNLDSLLNLLKINGKANPVLTNGVGEAPKELRTNPIVPPMQSIVLIKNVLFCSGDFAHLVIACTENRVLIWNLLNLRLQTVLKLSTEQIAIDPKNNLVSVFTKNRELHIFSPNDALTLYFRPNMPRVLGAVWLQREHPTSQAFLVNWQSRSILYFLTENNQIMYLGPDEEFEYKLSFAKAANNSAVKYSTFGTFATNKINNTQNKEVNREAVSIGVHGKAAVKSFLEMSSHTMAPLSLLCNDFLQSVIQLNLPAEEKKSRTSKSAVLINGYDEQSDNEDEYTGHRTLIEKAGITTKPTDSKHLITEEYLQKIAAETIEIEF